MMGWDNGCQQLQAKVSAIVAIGGLAVENLSDRVNDGRVHLPAIVLQLVLGMLGK